MKKNLLNEILRIKEVMGVSNLKPLLLEDSIVKRIARNIKDIFNGANPNITLRRGVSNTGNIFNFDLPRLGRVATATQQEMTNMLKYLDNNLSWSDLTENSKNLLKDLLKEMGQLDGNKLYDDVVDGIIGGGSNEEIWLKSIIDRAKYRDPITRRALGIDGALKEVLRDDEGIITDAIVPLLSKKIDDYDNELLSLQNGKLVKKSVEDVEKYLDSNITKPFTQDELKLLSKPKFVDRINMLLGKMGTEYDTLKRLFKNYAAETDMNKRKELGKLILQKMNNLSNYNKEGTDYMVEFIKELQESRIPEAVEIAKKLNKLKDENGGWDVVKILARDLSPLQKQWFALKEAMKSAFSAEIKAARIDKGLGKLSRFIGKALGRNTVEKSVEIAEGNFLNTLLVNSPRGWPSKKIVSELKEGSVDYYEKLKKSGQLPLAWISYFEEYLIRLVKFSVLTSAAKMVNESLRFNFFTTQEEKKCLLELSRAMKEQGIYTMEDLEQPFKNKAKWIVDKAPCIYKLNPDSRHRLLKVADYMTSLNSNDGEYWKSEFWEKVKNMKGIGGVLKIQPSRGLEIGVEMYELFEGWMNAGDFSVIEPPTPPQAITWEETEPSFKLWCEGQVPAYTFESWDNTTKTGSADAKKWKLKQDKSGFEPLTAGQSNADSTNVVTPVETNTEEVKTQLYNHLRTIPSLNNNPDPNKRIGPNDKPEIFDMGNNLWMFRAAGDSIMKFQYNPQTKTFSQIR